MEGFDNTIGSLGRPSPQYRIELRDADGTPTPAGEIGEIVVVPRDGKRPIGLFFRYLNDPERNARVWEGGVYHTGDTGYCDSDGHFYFHSRVDDLIKTGGYRVGPSEIENVLMEHEAVLECAVIGIPDPLRGRSIKAIVVLNPGFEAGKDTEKPSGIFPMPKWRNTISNKICKAALRQ